MHKTREKKKTSAKMVFPASVGMPQGSLLNLSILHVGNIGCLKKAGEITTSALVVQDLRLYSAV